MLRVVFLKSVNKLRGSVVQIVSTTYQGAVVVGGVVTFSFLFRPP